MIESRVEQVLIWLRKLLRMIAPSASGVYRCKCDICKKAMDGVVYSWSPTPWRRGESNRILDANGDLVLRISAVPYEPLAEMIVGLVNDHTGRNL